MTDEQQPTVGNHATSTARGSVHTIVGATGPSGPVPGEIGAPARGHSILLWAAAASLGLLFLQSSGVLGTGLLAGTRVTGSDLAAQFGAVSWYLPLLAPLLALLAWQWQPRRAPIWLLTAGVLAALPSALIAVIPGLFSDWMREPLAVITSAAPSLTFIGVLGAATLVWQAGLRTSAVVLFGTTVVIQLVGPLVVSAADPFHGAVLMGYSSPLIKTLTIIFVVVALAGAAAAIAWSLGRPTPAADPMPRPTWRVTAAACGAVLAQLLPVWWRPEPFVREPGEIADYLLWLGLAYLAIGVVLAAIGGSRILLAAAAIGLLVGTFATLLAPAVEVLEEAPVLSVIGAVVALAVAAAAALSRYRAQISITGLSVVVIGLLVIFLYSNSETPYSEYEGITTTITGILLVVGIVAAVCAVATVGRELAGSGDVPAVLAGLGAPFSLGIAGVVGAGMLDHPVGKAPIVGLLIPVMIGMAIAVGLLGAMVALGQRTNAPETGAGPVDQA